jgi:nickel-dependent lactate racemase
MSDRVPLNRDEIRSSLAGVREFLANLVGPVHECSVSIVVDDHSRPTPVSEILRPLLQELFDFGIEPGNVKVLVAVGTHEFDDRRILDRKMGQIPVGVEVIVPNCTDKSQFVSCGSLPAGVPVRIHKAFVDADARIAISGVYPHDEVSFSGGAKILIGILALETISGIHRRHGLLQRGGEVDTAFRKDLEELADLVGLGYSINCVVNRDKEVASLHCGDFRQALRAAVADARECFAVEADPEADIIIANAYPMDTALCVLGKSRWCFRYGKGNAHRILVTALCDCPLGRVPLAANRRERLVYLLKRRSGASAVKQWMKTLRRRWELRRRPGQKWDSAHVVFVPFVEESLRRRPDLIDGAVVEYDWNTVLTELLERFGPNSRVRVSVYRCAPMLFPKRSATGQESA